METILNADFSAEYWLTGRYFPKIFLNFDVGMQNKKKITRLNGKEIEKENRKLQIDFYTDRKQQSSKLSKR